MVRNVVRWSGPSLAFALLIAGCGQEAAPPKTKPGAAKAPETLVVKIGSASPLTGPQAHIVIDIRNGVQLAIEDANAAGVEIAGKKAKFELVAEDDEANPTNAPPEATSRASTCAI